MEEFFGRYRNLSVLLAVVLVQIILLGYQVRTAQGSSLLQEWTIRGFTPITKGVRGVTEWIGSSWDSYFWLIDTKQDNDQLRRQVERLKLENAGLRSTLARFGREERLIAYQQELVSQTVMAQVIGRGANSNSREIFISTGLDDGVTAGMPVITPDGIVGKVQASYPAAALVMLITDPEAGAGVLMARSRAGGILKGTGRGYCTVDYISHEVDVAMGETVFTSGDDRVFPKGLRIGEVVQLDRGTDFQEIRIKPFAALDRLEEVLVITAGIHQDLPESPQAQPPQFLMPLPETVDPLRTADKPTEQAAEKSAPTADPRNLEQSGRITDADRLRQYYQTITAQQGHRIGHGGPGTPAPNFNPQPAAGRTAPGTGTRAGQAAPASGARESAPQAAQPTSPATPPATQPAGSSDPTPLQTAPEKSSPTQPERESGPSEPRPAPRPAGTDDPPAGDSPRGETSTRTTPPATPAASGSITDPGPGSRNSAARAPQPADEGPPSEPSELGVEPPTPVNPPVRP